MQFLAAVSNQRQGHREGGQGCTMTPGPMDFRKAVGHSGPAEGPLAREGPIETTLRNQHVRLEDLLLFFGDHLILTGKPLQFR